MKDPHERALKKLIGPDLTAEQFEAAAEQVTDRRSLARVLEEQGLERAAIEAALAKGFRTGFVGSDASRLKDERLSEWDTGRLRYKLFAPLAWEDDKLVVAFVNPRDLALRDDLARDLHDKLGIDDPRPLKIKVTTLEDLARINGEEPAGPTGPPLPEPDPTRKLELPTAGGTPVVLLLDRALQDAYARRVDRVTIAASPEGALVSYTLGETTSTRFQLPQPMLEPVQRRLKVLADLKLIGRDAQEGEIAAGGVRLRVSFRPGEGDDEVAEVWLPK